MIRWIRDHLLSLPSLRDEIAAVRRDQAVTLHELAALNAKLEAAESERRESRDQANRIVEILLRRSGPPEPGGSPPGV